MKNLLTVGLVLAVASIAAAVDKEDLPDLIKELKNGKNAKARINAAEDIGKLGQVKASLVKDAIPVFLDVIKNTKDDVKVRAAAAEALGRCDPDPKDAVPVLVAIVKNEKDDMALRRAAANGLGQIGPGAKDAVKDMREAVKKEREKPMDQQNRQFIQAVNQAVKLINAK